MNAPIDIIISIIARKKREVSNPEVNLLPDYRDGMIDAYEDLINEFEGFKKLFQ